MQTNVQPPGNRKKNATDKQNKITNQDVENTVETGTSEDSTITESEHIVNEQSQDQAVNSSDRTEESGREEFLD